MQEWQYHIMPLEGEIEEINKSFNGMGFQGWELVSVTTLAVSSGEKTASVAVFKRPLNL